jgi:hypothetical protein
MLKDIVALFGMFVTQVIALCSILIGFGVLYNCFTNPIIIYDNNINPDIIRYSGLELLIGFGLLSIGIYIYWKIWPNRKQKK